jgi:hypothetical protein
VGRLSEGRDGYERASRDEGTLRTSLETLQEKNTMKTYVIDIETGPAELIWIEANAPKFDPDKVKVGNLKDREKIADKIAEARATHFTDIVNTAALSPFFGRILAIGVKDVDFDSWFALTGPEEEIIRSFWKVMIDEDGRLNQMIGHNVAGFDLPMIIRRGWAHGIDYPGHLRRGRYWADSVIDTMELWSLGQWDSRISLDMLCKHFGLPGKSGSGKDFAKLYEENPEEAIKYLENDLNITEAVWRKLTQFPK